MNGLKLREIRKVWNGQYLKGYELQYENKAGREKTYEMVSRNEIHVVSEIGERSSGVSIVAIRSDSMLLLREFRMGINRFVYNLCAGMFEKGENIEQCVSRELYEETGLTLKKIIRILPPSYSALAISDVKTSIVFAEVAGELADHTSENELIDAGFYTRDQITDMLSTEEFSSRAQLAAYLFTLTDLTALQW